jgi:hypothetical protein
MKNIISLILEWIGGATIITTALILIRIFWEKFIKPINCDHCYKVDGYMIGFRGTVLFLKCQACGKEKTIELSGGYEIIKREGYE